VALDVNGTAIAITNSQRGNPARICKHYFSFEMRVYAKSSAIRIA
jgi:hypothetical protein